MTILCGMLGFAAAVFCVALVSREHVLRDETAWRKKLGDECKRSWSMLEAERRRSKNAETRIAELAVELSNARDKIRGYEHDIAALHSLVDDRFTRWRRPVVKGEGQ